MAGLYMGTVVGGDHWEMETQTKGKIKGFSYKVLISDDMDETTKLCKRVAIVSAATPNKVYDESIVSGSAVIFDGEFQKGYNGAPDKMRYTNLRLKEQKKEEKANNGK